MPVFGLLADSNDKPYPPPPLAFCDPYILPSPPFPPLVTPQTASPAPSPQHTTRFSLDRSVSPSAYYSRECAAAPSYTIWNDSLQARHRLLSRSPNSVLYPSFGVSPSSSFAVPCASPLQGTDFLTPDTIRGSQLQSEELFQNNIKETQDKHRYGTDVPASGRNKTAFTIINDHTTSFMNKNAEPHHRMPENSSCHLAGTTEFTSSPPDEPNISASRRFSSETVELLCEDISHRANTPSLPSLQGCGSLNASIHYLSRVLLTGNLLEGNAKEQIDTDTLENSICLLSYCLLKKVSHNSSHNELHNITMVHERMQEQQQSPPEDVVHPSKTKTASTNECASAGYFGLGKPTTNVSKADISTVGGARVDSPNAGQHDKVYQTVEIEETNKLLEILQQSSKQSNKVEAVKFNTELDHKADWANNLSTQLDSEWEKVSLSEK